MPTITAYHALRDGSFRLSSNENETITWNPSNDIRQDGNNNRPLLCYRVDPSNNASNLHLQVQLNGVGIGSNARFSGTVSRTYMEIVRQPVNTGNNNISFEVMSGTGSLKISDVIVWYKRFIN